MSEGAPDIAAWARAHGARFEVEPLLETKQGRRVQVGFIVALYARLPLNEPPARRREIVTEIRERFRDVLQSLTPPPGSPGRLEIEPFRQAVFMAPKGGMQPEVAVTARAFHGQDYFAEVTEGDRKKVYEGTRRLVELGFQEGSRGR